MNVGYNHVMMAAGLLVNTFNEEQWLKVGQWLVNCFLLTGLLNWLLFELVELVG